VNVDVDPIKVQNALKGADYPASADELVEYAEDNDASDDVLDALRSLNGEFETPADVQEALAD
jgi:hypothetical protein